MGNMKYFKIPQLLFKIILFLVAFQLISFAQSKFRVEGIIMDEDPIAVINGEVFNEGDNINGAVISKITEDKVYFQQGGESLSRKIEGSTSKKEDKGNNYRRVPTREIHKSTQSSVSPPQSYLDAKDYYRQASVLASDNLGKAKVFYKKAIKNAQWAIPKVFGEKREEMNQIIKNSREVIFAFDEGKREARDKGKVTIGMTEEEVKKILGKPLEINQSQYGQWGSIEEQWVYGPYGPYLYFEDGILTSYQD